ncbi:MAG: hypothetical protein FJ125_11015, partial [Deltaproteobacteria bacterium]|nr:hypothetical protein [Deltaproteobacteria bacterium]
MQDNKDLRPSLLTLLFSLLFLGLAAAGCDEDDGDKKSEEQPPKLCTSDSQCQPTEYCMVATGLCLTGCRLAPADSCAAGFFCDEATHTCVANPCTGDADCAADHWCRIPEGETGGACVAGCRLEPDSCPEGKHCEAGAQDHACVDDVPITCATAGCPDGQHCHPGLLVCVQCLERAHCAEDELCVSNACEQACPDGCPEGEVCNLATRQCDPIDCVEAGVCPGGQICCPGTRRCTPGECRSATCCRGDLDCIEEGNRWCRDAHAANYYCGEDNSCGVETCRDDGSCPEDSWCDMATDPPACRRGCRMDGCDLPGQVCDPETRSCAYSRCPNGQQDCTCTPDEQFYCSPRTGRCEPGCCGDEVCDQVIGEHCDEESRVCTPLICARGNVDCRRAPWPDGTFCDGRLDPPRCMPGCQLDDDCPDGKPCTAGHVCGCQRDEDCAAGLKCRAELCVAECASHADCPDGYCGEDDRCQEGCLADAFEENDDRQHAALLPTADGQHQWLSICRGEEDWYAVHLRPGDSLAFQLSFDHEQMMVVAQIYHPDPELGALVTSTNGPLDDSAVVELDGARVVSEGDYLIRVMAVQPLLASGFYDMEVLFEAGHHCRGDALEGELGNDTQGQAATIEAQTYSELTLCPRDADWFRIALAAGDTITARATCDGQHRMKLALYDVQGAQLTFAESWCWNQVRRQVANAGTYFLEVSHSANAEREEIDPYELGVF